MSGPGASSGACLGQHLRHIVINGQQSAVLHKSVKLFWISSISPTTSLGLQSYRSSCVCFCAFNVFHCVPLSLPLCIHCVPLSLPLCIHCVSLCFTVFYCVSLSLPLCFTVFHCAFTVFLCVSLCIHGVSRCSLCIICVSLCLLLCIHCLPHYVCVRSRLYFSCVHSLSPHR